MQATFVAGANNTTNGTALGTDSERDVVVWQVIVGLPVASADLRLYDMTNPVNEASTNMKWFVTLPASLPTTGASPAAGYTWTFSKGLPLSQGGNFMQDQACDTTVIWEYLDEAVS